MIIELLTLSGLVFANACIWLTVIVYRQIEDGLMTIKWRKLKWE